MPLHLKLPSAYTMNQDHHAFDEPGGVCNPSFPTLSNEKSFRLDEGYSEDTRSLDDGDSAMGLELRNSTANLLEDPLVALQNAVMSLDECQRSGMLMLSSSNLPLSA